MSSATVTYHELPPMAAWAADAQPFPPLQAASNQDMFLQDQPWAHQHFLPHSQPPDFTLLHSNEYKPGAEALGWDAPPPPLFLGGEAEPPSPKKARLPCAPRPALSGVAEELCLVCGDKASGYHYNSLTCEGCKGFFRRSITRKAVYYCKYGGHCDIDMYMRRKCQCCRLRKCMDVGMRPERLRPESVGNARPSLVVIPEDQCRMKREAKQRMKGLHSAATPPAAATPRPPSPAQNLVTSSDAADTATPDSLRLSLEQSELLNRLVVYQHKYQEPSNESLACVSALSGEQPTQPFQHLAELTVISVQLIVEFTKSLPGFLTLQGKDQLTLLKASSTEVLMLRTARRYDASRDCVVLGNAETSWAYDRNAYRTAGIGAPTDRIFDFAASVAKMGLDNAEFALFTAVAIFSDRSGLNEPKKVEDIQEVYTSTLQSYMELHRPNQRGVFARLLMKLTDLRSLGSEQPDMILALAAKPPTVKVELEPCGLSGEDEWGSHSDSASSASATSHQPFPAFHHSPPQHTQ